MVKWTPLVSVGFFVVSLTACATTPTLSLKTTPIPAVSRVVILAEPAATMPVEITQPIFVTAEHGRLAEVAVFGPTGPLAGQMSADASKWTADSTELSYGTTYRISAKAVDSRGVAKTVTDDFTTVSPDKFFTGSVSPLPDTAVGIGTPITVTFDKRVSDRAAVERALVITTPVPIEGAWAWITDKVVEFRPRYYWPGDITATVALNLTGVQAKPGIYGAGDTQSVVTFGPAMVTRVNAQSYQATVYRNGEKLRVIPITTGKAGFETRSGIKVILSKERTRTMDAATGGTDKKDPEYYRILVEYAMRVTYSGEFLHAAPWSVGSQGQANVSHGCIGMSTENAQWLYDQTTVGDLVEVVGTSVDQDLGNGLTIWNQSWDEWLTRSSAGAVMTQSSR
jgi:lipoprotein-anchoring transpeptidase ErfK/SrfK